VYSREKHKKKKIKWSRLEYGSLNFIGEGNRHREMEGGGDVFTESTMNTPRLIMCSLTISKEDPKNKK
jgi:hypothetical protein